MPTVAALQMRSGPDREANEARAVALIEEAASRGATLIGLPEMWEHIGPASQKAAFAAALEPSDRDPRDGQQLARLRELAGKWKIWLLAGSIAERAEDGRFHNTSVLIAPDMSLAARYRKLHLFDVDIPDGARYRESEQVAPGIAIPPVAELDLSSRAEARSPEPEARFKLGLSICYDLRFPELYRKLAEQGADIISVPAAFTAYTGRAHWEVLLRARAIEDQAFVLAPAQVGQIGPASENRFCWGHACIIDPWGEVLADAGGEGDGMAIAEISRVRLDKARRELPALQNRRRDVLG